MTACFSRSPYVTILSLHDIIEQEQRQLVVTDNQHQELISRETFLQLINMQLLAGKYVVEKNDEQTTKHKLFEHK